MRILFGALHFGYFRNYESVIVALAARGHDVRLVADSEDAGGRALVERLAAENPRLTWEFAPSLETWGWARLGRQVRHGLECVRFADPRYDALPKYRRRANDRAPRIVRWLIAGSKAEGRNPKSQIPDPKNALMRRLIDLEHAIPPSHALVDYLASRQPDVVLLASVTNDGAVQMDHLKAALSLGLRTALPIYSWDHLSGKAVIHLAPDRVLVWNDAQRREATELHGLPADRIVVTGAQAYDHWFGRAPSRGREVFASKLGLDPARPMVTYVCSVLSRPAPAEVPFVLEWIRRLRGSANPSVRDVGVIIRPHPERMREWDGIDLSGLGQVAICGRNPIDADAKADYFDSLYHSAAVIGIITSAFIEAAVVGRPSLTIEDPRFHEHQEGAPHYHYLRDAHAGLLLVASDIDEHERQLARVLDGDPAAMERTRRFVRDFVRPFGLDVNATERFVDAIEALGGMPQPTPRQFGTGRARVLAGVLRLLSSAPVTRRLFWNELEQTIARSQRDRSAEERQIKDTLREERGRKHADQRRRQAAKRREQEAERRVKAARVATREREKERRRRASAAARRNARIKGDMKKLLGRSRRQAQRAATRSQRRARSAWAQFKGGIKQALGLSGE